MGKLATSVVIPTRGQVDQISRCISSILEQTLLPHEIIVVDAGENTDLNLFLKRKFPVDHPKIEYIHSRTCLTEARNIGVQRSSGDIVFFFDDDVILEGDYIEKVMKVFLSDKEGKIAGVIGNITNVKRDTSGWRAALRSLFSLDYYGNGKFRLSGLPTWVSGENKIMRTEFLSGCASAYRREVLNEFKFDEKLGVLGGYCFLEDADFSYRVSRKYTLMYTPFARLEHRAPRVVSPTKKRQYIFNHFYLFKKNVPKRLSNIFAFLLSLFGLLLFTSLFERNLRGFVSYLQGIADIPSKFP